MNNYAALELLKNLREDIIKSKESGIDIVEFIERINFEISKIENHIIANTAIFDIKEILGDFFIKDLSIDFKCITYEYFSFSHNTESNEWIFHYKGKTLSLGTSCFKRALWYVAPIIVSEFSRLVESIDSVLKVIDSRADIPDNCKLIYILREYMKEYHYIEYENPDTIDFENFVTFHKEFEVLDRIFQNCKAEDLIDIFDLDLVSAEKFLNALRKEYVGVIEKLKTFTEEY